MATPKWIKSIKGGRGLTMHCCLPTTSNRLLASGSRSCCLPAARGCIPSDPAVRLFPALGTSAVVSVRVVVDLHTLVRLPSPRSLLCPIQFVTLQ